MSGAAFSGTVSVHLGGAKADLAISMVFSWNPLKFALPSFAFGSTPALHLCTRMYSSDSSCKWCSASFRLRLSVSALASCVDLGVVEALSREPSPCPGGACQCWSSSLVLAAFLFLVHCFPTRHSSLAPLCFGRLMFASHFCCLFAANCCACSLVSPFFLLAPSATSSYSPVR